MISMSIFIPGLLHNILASTMGYNCVARALDAIEGKEIDSFYPSEPAVIDSANIDEFLVKLEDWTA